MNLTEIILKAVADSTTEYCKDCKLKKSCEKLGLICLDLLKDTLVDKETEA